MAMRDELGDFPSIRKAWDHCTPQEAKATFLRILLDNHRDGFHCGLPEVEAALAGLLETRSPAELDEQLRSLLSGESDWDKAQSERLALNFFAERQELNSTGWPTQGYGGTPPFDGRAQVRGVPVPFDIKSAKTGLFGWLRDVLEPIAKPWAPGVDLALSFRHKGVYARQVAGPDKRAIESAFKTFLGAHTAADLPLSTTLTVANATIDIELAARNDDDVTFGTHIGSPVARAEAMATTMLSHIETKAKHASTTGAASFFLVYVRPHSSGGADFTPLVFADLQSAVLRDITTVLHHERWLGTLYLDWTPQPFGVHVMSNPHATGSLCPRLFERWAMGIPDGSVAARAYAAWVERGGSHGDDLTDWLEAEQRLLGIRAPAPTTPRVLRPKDRS